MEGRLLTIIIFTYLSVESWLEALKLDVTLTLWTQAGVGGGEGDWKQPQPGGQIRRPGSKCYY